VDYVVRDLVCGPCSLDKDSVGLHRACRATRATATIADVVDQIAVDSDVVKIEIAGVAAGDLNAAAAVRTAVGFDVVDRVVGNVYERSGHVQSEVVARRTGIGNLKTVEGDVAASEHDHGAVAGH